MLPSYPMWQARENRSPLREDLCLLGHAIDLLPPSGPLCCERSTDRTRDAPNNHPAGTCAMGSHELSGVVDPRPEAHGTDKCAWSTHASYRSRSMDVSRGSLPFSTVLATWRIDEFGWHLPHPSRTGRSHQSEHRKGGQTQGPQQCGSYKGA